MVYTYIILIILTISFSIYVIKDGFTLALCVLLPYTNRTQQGLIYNYLLPSWDANQTWLVFTMAALYGAFSKFFGIVLSSLYLPFIAMLLLFIIRGAAIEFSLKDKKHRFIWINILAMTSLFILVIQTCVVLYLILNQQYSAYNFNFKSPLIYLYYGAAFLVVFGFHFMKGIEYLAMIRHRYIFISLLSYSILFGITGILFDTLSIGFHHINHWHIVAFATLCILTMVIYKWQKKYCIRIFCGIVLFGSILAIIGYLFPYYDFIGKSSLLTLSSNLISIKIICIASMIMLPVLLISIHFLHKIFQKTNELLVY